MLIFLSVLPALIALVLVFVYRLVTDRQIDSLNDRIFEIQETVEHLKRMLHEEHQQREILREELLKEVQKNTDYLAALRAFLEKQATSKHASVDPVSKEEGKQRELIERLRAGQSASDIAKDVGVPVGEVELMRNLRNFTKHHDTH